MLDRRTRGIALLAALGALMGGRDPIAPRPRKKQRELTRAERAREHQRRLRDSIPKERRELLQMLKRAKGTQAELRSRWHGYTYATITSDEEVKARRQARNARKRRNRAYRASRRRRDAA